MRDDTTSFTLNLKQGRDRGFHVYRGLCQFLFKIGRRCIRSTNLPPENDQQGMLNISIRDAKALCIADFLIRFKLDSRLNSACKTKATAEKGEKKNGGLTLETISGNYKEEFGRNARSYVIFFVQRSPGTNPIHFGHREGAWVL